MIGFSGAVRPRKRKRIDAYPGVADGTFVVTAVQNATSPKPGDTVSLEALQSLCDDPSWVVYVEQAPAAVAAVLEREWLG